MQLHNHVYDNFVVELSYKVVSWFIIVKKHCRVDMVSYDGCKVIFLHNGMTNHG